MSRKMPIILNEIKFSALGISRELFNGAVLYARAAKLLQWDTMTGHGGYHNDLDLIIEAYIKEALSQFGEVYTCFTSKVITSDNELNHELSTYKAIGYDKRSFTFYIHQGSSTPSDVLVQNLSVCIGVCSSETRKTAHSCFCNEHYHDPVNKPCISLQSLKIMVNAIENIFDYIPAERAMIEIKNEMRRLENKGEEIINNIDAQSIYGQPVMYQTNSLYINIYKPWRQRFDKIAEELKKSNISLVSPYGKIDEEYITQYLNVPEDEQFHRMIMNLNKHKEELRKVIGDVTMQTV